MKNLMSLTAACILLLVPTLPANAQETTVEEAVEPAATTAEAVPDNPAAEAVPDHLSARTILRLD